MKLFNFPTTDSRSAPVAPTAPPVRTKAAPSLFAPKEVFQREVFQNRLQHRLKEAVSKVAERHQRQALFKKKREANAFKTAQLDQAAQAKKLLREVSAKTQQTEAAKAQRVGSTVSVSRQENPSASPSAQSPPVIFFTAAKQVLHAALQQEATTLNGGEPVLASPFPVEKAPLARELLAWQQQSPASFAAFSEAVHSPRPEAFQLFFETLSAEVQSSLEAQLSGASSAEDEFFLAELVALLRFEAAPPSSTAGVYANAAAEASPKPVPKATPMKPPAALDASGAIKESSEAERSLTKGGAAAVEAGEELVLAKADGGRAAAKMGGASAWGASALVSELGGNKPAAQGSLATPSSAASPFGGQAAGQSVGQIPLLSLSSAGAGGFFGGMEAGGGTGGHFSDKAPAGGRFSAPEASPSPSSLFSTLLNRAAGSPPTAPSAALPPQATLYTLLDKIVSQIRKTTLSGKELVTFRLQADSFGPIGVNLIRRGNEVAVKLMVESAAIKELLETHLSALKNQLAMEKFEVSALGVELRQGEGGGGEFSADEAAAELAEEQISSGKSRKKPAETFLSEENIKTVDFQNNKSLLNLIA